MQLYSDTQVLSARNDQKITTMCGIGCVQLILFNWLPVETAEMPEYIYGME